MNETNPDEKNYEDYSELTFRLLRTRRSSSLLLKDDPAL